MTVFFHYLQSGQATLYAKGELVRRELDDDYLMSRTISRPPADLFYTYVLSETAMTQLSHAEDVFMAKEGITTEGIIKEGSETPDELTKIDEQFISARLHSPAPQRFGFEVHSDDGKRIRATVFEVQGNQRIKTLFEAEKVMITTYDAVVGDDGKIQYAEVYPAGIVVRPAVWAAPLTEEMKLHPEKVGALPVEFVQFRFKYKKKPQIGRVADEIAAKPAPLPGLGGNMLKPPSGFDVLASTLKANRMGLPTELIGADGIVDYDAATLGQLYLDRFNEALMLLHVKGREPKVVRQATEAPSGKMRANKTIGQRSGVERIDIDPVEFRILKSTRAADIKRIFENPEKRGYGNKHLHFVKRHPRRKPLGGMTEVSPYTQCEDEAVRIRCTALVQALERHTLDGNEEMKEQISIELAREFERHGAPTTKARISQGVVTKVNIAEPGRNNPPAPESKTDRAPNG